ncbi:MAG: hypothetical protein JXX28_14390 [Deltaproteobacteria bacterium]|nr:hypothetical protein [Deltaproteobacteria bacterium]
MRLLPLVLLLPLLSCTKDEPAEDELFTGEGWPLGEVVAVEGRGLRATLDTAQGPLMVVRLAGTHEEMGRQLGVLVGPEVDRVWRSLTASMGDDLGMSQEAVEAMYGPLLDTVWAHMVPQVPAPWLAYIDAADEAMGGDEVCTLCRVTALSNISDMNFDSMSAALATIDAGRSAQLQAFYAEGPDAASALGAEPPAVPGPFATCSFFAAWGARSADGHLYASRNLDWSADTGISAAKALMVYVPEGAGAGHPFATIGYAGMPGALAGLSASGVAVAEVGSTSVLERIAAEPWIFRHMEILEHAEDLDQAIAYHTLEVGDGFLRPQSNGYNFMVAWGDPVGGGAGAEAAVIEANGAMVSVHRGGETTVHLFAEDGSPDQVLTGVSANREADAVEVDRFGAARGFACGEGGAPLLDERGLPTEQEGGCPLPTGLPLEQAIFRGDEAMSHWNRRFQMASHGPQSGDGLMITSGSYTERYLRSHLLLQAWEQGVEFARDGQIIVAAAPPVGVGMDQAELLASQVARDDNILSVVYDATALDLRVSYEQGTGDSWVPANALPYFPLSLAPAFAYE